MTEEELNLLRSEIDIDIETETIDAIDWFQGLAVILTPVCMEFKLSGWMIGAGTTSTHIGAMVGALLWGYISDKFGRQPAFLWTLIISAIGGIAASLSTNIYMLCASLAFLGCGIGGNLPVDARIFVVHFHESPKNLITRGKFQEAVDILNILADENNVQLDISAQDFSRDRSKQESHLLQDYAPLFKKDFFVSTTMIIMIWVLVAVGYNIFNGFLPKFLQSSGLEPLTIDETYRNYVLVSIAGVPGSILGTFLTDTFLGRKGTMAISTLLTAAALFLFTVLKSNAGQLIAACSESFLQNIMYGIIYTYTPEVFPTYIRGKAVGLASASGRLTGAFAPVLAGYLVSQSLTLPLYLSASLIGVTGIMMIFLPIETRGSAAR
ncbi:hypothetical protein HDV04_005083 [Boothiomyces sp. JEL0838]|nr:hypothetical protein HDV04_005083 [Boothiomyces sp. JEL0838]